MVTPLHHHWFSIAITHPFEGVTKDSRAVWREGGSYYRHTCTINIILFSLTGAEVVC